jgi:hypothetical protein
MFSIVHSTPVATTVLLLTTLKPLQVRLFLTDLLAHAEEQKFPGFIDPNTFDLKYAV